MPDYVSVKSAALQWGVSERRIQKLCGQGRVGGAVRFGRAWAIPAGTCKPPDARHGRKRKKNCRGDTEIRTNIELYGDGTKLLLRKKECVVYQLRDDPASGSITKYEVLPGIELFYNDFCLSEKFEHHVPVSSDIMEINHCREGRFECEFQNNEFAYLGSGDLAVNMLWNQPKTSCFPLSHYQGISIIIDIERASKPIGDVSKILGSDTLDLHALQDKLCPENSCCILRATDSIQHVFSELYRAPECLMCPYIKLKVIELILFLSAANTDCEQRGCRYFRKEQIDTVKEIRRYLTENLSRRFTLAELSEQFHIPLTSMKQCFKSVWGSPIYTYLRDYRLHTAAAMLRETELGVAEIAWQVGYDSPAKFSAAFKQTASLSPSEYRKNFVRKGYPASDRNNL
ncbi:MAG: helix-turn-helix domain-containing protein [bacterium]